MPKHITSEPLLVLTLWADTAYDANGTRLYTDYEIAAAKDAIARLDRVLGEARAILALHRINERDQGPWGDLWCAVAAADAKPIEPNTCPARAEEVGS